MSRVSIYLNFQGNTEEAFNFYKSVFKTEFAGPVSRMSDAPPMPGAPPLPDNEKNAIMHMALPILDGTLIQGTDMLESMGHKLRIGNNTTICIEPDSKEETDRLFNALSAGGSEMVAPQEMFWGAYWGVCLDKYGVRWMFNFYKQ
ncbi:MAG TPA: VOC family protein [Puia sp.]|jgi:PhnB protein|nr:VOC family protein [Puia sp.]